MYLRFYVVHAQEQKCVCCDPSVKNPVSINYEITRNTIFESTIGNLNYQLSTTTSLTRGRYLSGNTRTKICVNIALLYNKSIITII